ncbi:putative GTP cyclohydrolase-2 [Smittium culicis]|uniref:GTP cyclohydrolase II n=2 Tax=Smittium culicis TaxID=133412 RepID=A0A1R1XQ72_9FUNG|nr:putative GTP cyclohydrolase-2 [Smittium culicis]
MQSITNPQNTQTSGISDTSSSQPAIVNCRVKARIPYPNGHFYLHLYDNNKDKKEHLAIVFGDNIQSSSLNSIVQNESDLDRKIRGASDLPPKKSSLSSPPLVRIHSECYTGETVSSTRCDCGYQLAEAMRLMSLQNSGVIVYLRQEGRNIGLMDKLKAYNLQDMGHDTVNANLLLNHPADGRSYDIAQAILNDFAISDINLLTNNPDKISKISHNSNINVVSRVPMIPSWWLNSENSDHMETFSGIESHLPHPSNDLNTLVSNSPLNTSTDSSTPPNETSNPNSKLAPATTYLSQYHNNSLLDHNDSASLDSDQETLPASRAISTPPYLPSTNYSSYHRHLNSSKNSMAEADRYLLTKALKMGHILDIPKY